MPTDTRVTRRELFEHFDKIRSALAVQEKKRTEPGFGHWLVRALPLWCERIAAVDAAQERAYGRVLCAYYDWLDARKLAWRGEVRWKIPSGGPLHFTPPSMSGLLARAGEVIRELHLEDALTRSARCGVAPIERTRGGRGRRLERGMTVRASK